MAEVVSILTAQAAAIAARPVMGLSRVPTVVNYGSYVAIELDSQAQEEAAAFLIRQLDAEPGAVRVVGLGNVLVRVLARKYGAWAAGLVGGAFGLGWFTGGRKGGRR